MKTRTLTILSAAALQLVACRSDDQRERAVPTAADGATTASTAPSQDVTTPASATPEAEVLPPRFLSACPMVETGTTVQKTKTPDGLMITFTTTTTDVNELRDRVRRLGALYEEWRGEPLHWRRVQSRSQAIGASPDSATQGFAPIQVEVTDIEGGAQLALTSEDPANLPMLRKQLRRHRLRMSAGECWMFEGGTAPPAEQPAPAVEPLEEDEEES